MNPNRRLLLSGIAAAGALAVAGPVLAKKKEHHHSGKDVLGEKVKKNGKHLLEKKGKHTATVEVKDEKIAGLSVKHDTKGDVPVKKYKTNKNMAATNGISFVAYSGMLAQAYSTGTTYIGYAYYDDYGDEVIYWWPYEMIYDPWTGTTEYVPYV